MCEVVFTGNLLGRCSISEVQIVTLWVIYPRCDLRLRSPNIVLACTVSNRPTILVLYALEWLYLFDVPQSLRFVAVQIKSVG